MGLQRVRHNWVTFTTKNISLKKKLSLKKKKKKYLLDKCIHVYNAKGAQPHAIRGSFTYVHRAPHLEGSMLGLMLCCCCLESFSMFEQGDLNFICTGPHKWRSWCCLQSVFIFCSVESPLDIKLTHLRRHPRCVLVCEPLKACQQLGSDDPFISVWWTAVLS